MGSNSSLKEHMIIGRCVDELRGLSRWLTIYRVRQQHVQKNARRKVGNEALSIPTSWNMGEIFAHLSSSTGS